MILTSAIHLPKWIYKKTAQWRNLATCLVLLCFFIILYCFSVLAPNPNIFEIESPNYVNGKESVKFEKFLINTSQCKIPNDQPFNADALKVFYREPYPKCTDKPLLSYINKNQLSVTLNINQSNLHLYSHFEISCCYSIITRIVIVNKSDDGISYSNCVPFNTSVVIGAAVVQVNCRTFFDPAIYSNVHYIISANHVSSAKLQKNVREEVPVGVVFVGIDSVSKLNLVRTMPKTHSFLEQNEFISLNGYTKIEDNTFPNLMAILTGKTWQQIDNYCDPSRNILNNCDIIWEKFNNLGYITAYAEDQTNIGTFNNNRLGFRQQPTDFYFRPYLIAAEKLPSIKKFAMNMCAGPETSGERIMNLIQDYIISFKNYPKFALFWMNTFSHDNVNLPSSMDDKVEQFLQKIYPHIENTILVFFSDHGFRFGNLRYTHSGWLEERLPFIYIHLPKKFRTNHPKQTERFLINSRRLTTPFDLHMTLQHILSFKNHTYEIMPSEACPKCQSLFDEISETRTCSDAAIDRHWCLCSGHSYIDPKTEFVLEAANYVVSKLNTFVKSSTQGNKCAIFMLANVASSGISETYRNDKNQSLYNLLLMLETRPPAMFEATVEIVDQKSSSFRLIGDISRTNRYADNSKCIKGLLQKYCYCEGIWLSIKSAICDYMNCL